MKVIQELRLEYKLDLLLEIAHLPRSTFYYYSKKQNKVDKYAKAKIEIAEIYHENKGTHPVKNWSICFKRIHSHLMCAMKRSVDVLILNHKMLSF